MITRRTFIAAGITAAAGLAIAECMGPEIRTGGEMKKGKIKKGLVVWYSQTGNTKRIGRVIASAWRKQGIQVKESDYRAIDPATLSAYDIIAAGSPVYYYEVPENFREWLRTIPDITGTPVASFVTFGGTGGNQHNTACELLGLLSKKGGVPAGIATFGNMSTFAPTWSTGSVKRILRYSHLPDNDTFTAARNYADIVLLNVKNGKEIQVKSKISFNNMIRGGISIGFTKLVITEHRIDEKKCIACGTCEKTCPVSAIGPGRDPVDTDRCIACFGCVNNCPVNAVRIKFAGKEVYGYREFLKRNNITVNEPRV